MSISTARTSPPADTQRTNSPLVGIVREHITFESSQIGPVETVDEHLEVDTENRVSEPTFDDGSQGMPALPGARNGKRKTV